jgi:hypothetical protein
MIHYKGLAGALVAISTNNLASQEPKAVILGVKVKLLGRVQRFGNQPPNK